jgi:hypothetical protein
MTALFWLVKTNSKQRQFQAKGIVLKSLPIPSLQSFRTGFGISPTARMNMFLKETQKLFKSELYRKVEVFISIQG